VEIRSSDRRLLVDGQPAAVGARAFDLLQVLFERRDRVVSKDELLDLVWPGVVVEENNLQVHVSALRKLLGRDAIATIPGRGYRYTVADAAEDGPSPTARGRGAADGAATAGARGNVPSLVEMPIGRETELGELRSLLGRQRLVSIVGPGGIGKTTVALALADALRAAFNDGVWWVELAAVADARLIGGTVAHALGVRLAADRPPAGALAAALGEINAVILLDDCEHLTTDVAPLVDVLLARIPSLRIVVTSQEPLRIPREHVFRLDALPVPARDTVPGPAEALGHAAVRLFVERARAADRRFELNASNVGAVVEICRRLDGIPLAIELAAARVPLMGAAGLRRKLDERFRILTTGARSVLPRHQTLRATLEWSHALLSDVEQIVFRRLAVFSGGATLTMVQAVAADGALDEWTVLSALGVLVDRSLVVADGGDEPRYRLLETMRAYAAERLSAAGEAPAWARRHAEAVLDLLLPHAGRMVNGEASPLLAAEQDNVRAALDWALGKEGDDELAVGLATYSFPVWKLTAAFAEGLGYSETAAARLGPATPIAARARLLRVHAAMGMTTNRRDCFDAALLAAELMRETGDRIGLYEALLTVTASGARRHEFAAAHAAAAEAARIDDPSWEPGQRLYRAFAEWMLALREGRYAAAREHALRQAELGRALGSKRAELLALGNVAACDAQDGPPERAVKSLRSVIAELERIGYGHNAGQERLNLFYALLRSGALEEAHEEARRTYALLRREGDQASLIYPLAKLAAARGDPGAALKVAGYEQKRIEREGISSRWTLSPEELAPGLAPREREALMAEGAQLAEEEAIHLVLAEGAARRPETREDGKSSD